MLIHGATLREVTGHALHQLTEAAIGLHLCTVNNIKLTQGIGIAGLIVALDTLARFKGKKVKGSGFI